jgi:hypothetical protein
MCDKVQMFIENDSESQGNSFTTLVKMCSVTGYSCHIFI